MSDLDEFSRDIAAHVRAYLAGVHEIAAGESPETAVAGLHRAAGPGVDGRRDARRGRRRRPAGPVRGGRRPRPGHRADARVAGRLLEGIDEYASVFDPLVPERPVHGRSPTTSPTSPSSSSTGCGTWTPAATRKPCGGGSSPTCRTGGPGAERAARPALDRCAPAAGRRRGGRRGRRGRRPPARDRAARYPGPSAEFVRPEEGFLVALVVQKYGGSSVADAAGIKRVAAADRRHQEGRARRRRRGLGHGRHHRRAASTSPSRSRPTRPAASSTCCSPPASASRWPCSRWRSTTSAPRRARSPAARPA